MYNVSEAGYVRANSLDERSYKFEEIVLHIIILFRIIPLHYIPFYLHQCCLSESKLQHPAKMFIRNNLEHIIYIFLSFPAILEKSHLISSGVCNKFSCTDFGSAAITLQSRKRHAFFFEIISAN